MAFIGLFVLAIAAVLAFGWIVPLVAGFVRRRRGKPATALFVIGGVWGVIGVGLASVVAVGAVVAMGFREHSTVERYDPTQIEGPSATIRVPVNGKAEVQVRSRKDRSRSWRLSGKGGEIAAPAEELVIQRCTLNERDEKGRNWSAYGYFYGDRAVTLDLSDGAEKELPVGPPFSATILKQKTRDRVSLNLIVTDRTGRKFTIRGPGGKSQPRFEVRDEQDEVVWQGKFEYG